jgi:excinuclease ABC subunit B
MYADTVTDSMRRMLAVTEARREIQLTYNRTHGITPTRIVKELQDSLAVLKQAENLDESMVACEGRGDLSVHEVVQELEKEMLEAAQALEFERAALLRDQLNELKAVHGLTPAEVKESRYGNRGEYAIRKRTKKAFARDKKGGR